jgi:hypothetical protein
MKRTLVAVLIALGCSSPEQQAREAHDSVESWAATGKMLAQEWSRGNVSAAYAKSTAKVAIAELEKLDTPERDRALKAWREMQNAVSRNDPAAAERAFTP